MAVSSETNPTFINKRFLAICTLIFIGSSGYYMTWTTNSEDVAIFFSRITHFDNGGRILLNNTDFKFIYNPKHICSSKNYKREKKTLVIFIHSSRSNFRGRQLIRATFGSVLLYENFYLPVVFLLGSATNEEKSTISDMIDKEFKEHHDLIVGNFPDTNAYLSHKHLMGYKWVTEYCHRADFYAKADQGTIVDLFYLVDLISTPRKDANESWSYTCSTIKGMPPSRSPGTYKVTKKQFPGDKYPEYCGYSIYLTQIEAVREILRVHDLVPSFIVDNAFVTGVLREYVNKNPLKTVTKKKIITISKEVKSVDAKTKIEFKEKEYLGYMVESKKANTTCQLWKKLLNFYNLQRIYVSTCNSLF